MAIDPRVAPYLGRVLAAGGEPAGTCFQVVPGVLVTAWHVLDALGAGEDGAIVALDPLRGGPVRQGLVARADPLHDLAVLVTHEPLDGCVAGLAASDEVRIGDRVVITGVPVVDDPERSYRSLDADGHWGGGATIDDQIPIGRVVASAVMRGMSGAPVIAAGPEAGEPTVVGVVSGRYNSADGWGRDSVWVARTEDLAPSLAGLGEITVSRRGWAGAAELTLSVTDSVVTLRGDGVEVSGSHAGTSQVLADAVRGLRAGRARLAALRGQDLAAAPAVLATASAVGLLLADSFLPAPVAAALGEVVADARRRWAPVRLGIDVPGPLRALPWEALALPGAHTPLALHPLLVVYRRQAAGPVPTSSVAGPLRVVIAISAPLSGGGGVLDYERELRNMLAAVRGARQGQALVRIVHFATTSEIRAALAAGPAHVLHLSGHGRPGLIELEDDEGNARVLDAERFVAEAIPPGRMPTVIALSACDSDAATAAGDPSFAAALMRLGAACVIGAETAVTDVYATRLFSRIYGALADAEAPDVIGAVAEARRTVQQHLTESADRRDQRLARCDEWAVVTVLAAAGSVRVIDPSAGPAADDQGAQPPAPRLPAGLLARDPGEFVGRRRAQRRWPAELLGPGGACLVLHGIGGVGKTTLAAELVRRIAEREPERLPVVAASGLSGGAVSVDQVLSALARALRRRSRGTRPDLDQAADLAERPDQDWQYRLDVLRDDVLDVLPVLIVLDNFEDNLSSDSVPGRPGWRDVADQDLAALLAALVTRPGRCRLLITSRYPFALPGQAERAASFRPVGPLSAAETMKLAWALPALDRLTEAELERVWRMVGGHPRCLEYLDALLSGGRSSYPDVTARLAANLASRPDVPDLDEWFAAHGALEPALAQTLTLAADDVLLDQLLAGLAAAPGAEDLLLGLSVYRSPVDQAGLLFQIGTPDASAEATPPGQRRLPAPALREPDGSRRLVDACTASSLLARDTGQDPPGLLVHRWTASELQRRWRRAGRGEQLTAAHLRAAAYWQWRVQAWPQDRVADLDDLIEARHHLFAAGQADQADRLTWAISDALHEWGAWDREDALIRDTLAQLPADAAGRSNWVRQLGDIASGRARISDAGQLYRQALHIDQQHAGLHPGNIVFQRNLSVSYDRLAELARIGGDTQEAARLYRQALAIDERLAGLDPDNVGFQRNLSVSYDRLAELARTGGDTQEAARMYQRAVEIRERLAGLHPETTIFASDLSVSYDRLAGLAKDAGDTEAAGQLYQRALDISERLTELDPANIAFASDLSISYERLGDLAGSSGDIERAARLYQQKLAIDERLVGLDPDNTEFQRNLSISYDRLADVAGGDGDAQEAARLYQLALAIRERLTGLDPGNTTFASDLAVSCDKLADLAKDAEDVEGAGLLYRRALAIRQRLAELDPGNAAFARDLAFCRGRLADLGGDSPG